MEHEIKANYTSTTKQINALCPICNSDATLNLNKTVSGAATAEVFQCQICEHAYLANYTIPAGFYETEFNTFMAERSGDDTWDLAEAHFRRRREEGRERVRMLSSILNFNEVQTVLELGSSTGFLLDAIRELNPSIRVTGVEPGDTYRQFSVKKGFNVVEDTTNLRGQSFDLIVSFFVLEHLENPRKWLKQLVSLLSPNGLFVAVVPNVNEALVSRFHCNKYDQFVWQAPHLSYFSEASIRKLFDEIGNEVFVRNQQRYSLNNHLSWLIGAKPEKNCEFDFVTPELDSIYKRNLEMINAADSLIAGFKRR